MALRNERDASLEPPALILPSIQVNIRAGELPPPEFPAAHARHHDVEDDQVGPHAGCHLQPARAVESLHDLMPLAFEVAPRLVARMPDHELWLAEFRDSENNVMALMEERR